MPTTYNGVGTHYYGKKNKKTRHAVCQLCGHKTELTSYETRLWFVFLFIPVIPFGRKRITDQCKVCGRHYAVPAKQWETGRQSATAAAMDQFRREQSEEAALDVHATLLAFQQHEEAGEFRSSMLDRFHDKPLLHAGLAMQMENCGLPEEADRLWDKAFELDPELPETRIGMGRRRMFENKLDEARELMSFLEEPGAEKQYDLNPLFDLAGRYQNSGDHEKALDIMQVLLAAYPDIGKDHQIRAFIKKSEKIVRTRDSILPPVEHSLSKLFSSQYSSGHRWGIGILAALVLGSIGLAINNEYIRRHQPLTVINDTGLPANITVDDQPPISVTGLQKIFVDEGTHKIAVSGPVEEQHTLTMKSGYWQRWSTTPVWIINVNGEAIIADMKVHYAVHPRPPTVNYNTDPILIKPHIDHPFEEPPESLEVGSERSVRTLSALSWLELGDAEGADIAAFYALKEKNDDLAFTWAERKLRRNPGNAQLLSYLSSEVTEKNEGRFRTLLEAGLDHRPVALQWHRAYQDIPDVSADHETLLKKYDDLLNADTDNAVLMYLRARIDGSPRKEMALMQKAIAADDTFAYPLYSLGYKLVCAGEWQAALDSFDKAAERGMEESEVRPLRHEALVALGRHSELEELYRDELKENPASVRAASTLAEILIQTDRNDEANQILTAACRQFEAMSNGRFPAQVHAARAVVAYFRGDIAAAMKEAGQQEDAKVLAEIIAPESRTMAEASAAYELSRRRTKRWIPLTYSLAFHHAGDQASADAWHARAIEQLRMLGDREKYVTDILAAQTINSDLLERLKDASEKPIDKAAILTHLGLRAESDDVRDLFFAEAEKMMVRRTPPYLLLRNILDRAGAGP